MFQIDKAAFGNFIAALRRDRRLTQRDLAEKLCVSDKAVSKWETGKSLPDISLLPPLAEELGVTVTELLSARRLDRGQALEPGETEELLRRAVEMAPPAQARGRLLGALLAAFAVAGAELGILFGPLAWRPEPTLLWVLEGMAAGFGVYFFLFAKTRLPGYYDENKINYYVDGFLRIHLPGARFNSSTWPRMLAGFRVWCAAAMMLWPPVYYAVDRLTSPGSPARLVVMLVFVFTIFIPAYIPSLSSSH